MTLWQWVCRYFNMNYYGKWQVPRKQYMMVGSQFGKATRLDEYRCLLENCGYLRVEKRGMYMPVKEIPSDLTYRAARREAYGDKYE
jgi:hypothetical protein